MQPLTCRAVAVFCIEWHLPAQLVFYAATVTPAIPPCLELFIFAVDSVRLFVLPRVIVACASLELVTRVSVDVLGGYSVILLLVLWSHAWGICAERREG
jgi:hypothetical protein